MGVLVGVSVGVGVGQMYVNVPSTTVNPRRSSSWPFTSSVLVSLSLHVAQITSNCRVAIVPLLPVGMVEPMANPATRTLPTVVSLQLNKSQPVAGTSVPSAQDPATKSRTDVSYARSTWNASTAVSPLSIIISMVIVSPIHPETSSAQSVSARDCPGGRVSSVFPGIGSAQEPNSRAALKITWASPEVTNVSLLQSAAHSCSGLTKIISRATSKAI